MPHSQAASVTDHAAAPHFTHADVMRVIYGIVLCILLAAVDQTVVIPAVPAIASDLGAYANLSWIVAAYLIYSQNVLPNASEPLFGFPLRKDGLYLQQDPEEYAAFVHYMATKMPPASLTLDIGTAAGGQTKFLRDYFSADKTIVVDIGRPPETIVAEIRAELGVS